LGSKFGASLELEPEEKAPTSSCPFFSNLNPQSSILNPQRSILNPRLRRQLTRFPLRLQVAVLLSWTVFGGRRAQRKAKGETENGKKSATTRPGGKKQFRSFAKLFAGANFRPPHLRVGEPASQREREKQS